MHLDTLKKANELYKYLENLKQHYESVSKILSDNNDNHLEIRIGKLNHGLTVGLDAKNLRPALEDYLKKCQAEIDQLQTDFNSL